MLTISYNQADDSFTMSRAFFAEFVNSLAESLAKAGSKLSPKADDPLPAMDSAFLSRFPDASRILAPHTPRPAQSATQPAAPVLRFPHADRLYRGI